jgi:hypothetical protein
MSAEPVTATCDYCGETLTLTGNIWPHANGLLMCGGPKP